MNEDHDKTMAMRVGQNIRRLRKARGLTMAQLAELMKSSPHLMQISRMEKGDRRVNLEWVEEAADALKVTIGEILDRVDTSPVRRAPLIGAIAAGQWREAVQEAEVMVPCAHGGPNTFALRPTGDSMDKVVGADALIFVDPDDRALADGALYAVMNSNSEATFKRFRSDPMRLEPVSTNPDHLPIAIGEEPFTVIGRVVAALRPL